VLMVCSLDVRDRRALVSLWSEAPDHPIGS
jgi:hypothetical protein